MTVFETAQKLLPERLQARLKPVVGRAYAILSGEDGQSRSERMALATFVIRVLSAAIVFFSQVVLARVLGEFDYGIFVFVWAIAVIAGSLSCFGADITIIRFLPGYRENRSNAHVMGLTRTARIFVMLAATAIAVLGGLALRFFEVSIEHYYLVPLHIGLFTLPLIALGDVLDGTARSNTWPLPGIGAIFLLRPTLILVFMLLAIYVGFPATAETALYAALIATFVTTALQYAVVTTKIRRKFSSPRHAHDLRAWFAVTLPIFFIEGFYFLLTNADVVIVGLFVPPDQVGIYFAAARTMAIVHFVYYAVKAAAGPRFAEMVATGDSASLAGFARQSVAWTFWPSLTIGIAIVLAGPFLLSLFGEAFMAGHAVMIVLFAGILAKALVGPGEVLLTMVGHQTVCALVYLGVLAFNVALSIALIPAFGLVGAAAATSLAMTAEAVAVHIAVRRTLGISMFIAGPRPVSKEGEAT